MNYSTYETLCGFLVPGLVLAFHGVVQLSVRKKTGAWKEGGASLLAGAIIAGVAIGLLVLIFSQYYYTRNWNLRVVWIAQQILKSGFAAGLVLALIGVVQLCTRNKKGPWKEWGASLLGGVIIVAVSTGLLLAGLTSSLLG